MATTASSNAAIAVNRVPMDAPWRWLAAGWRDMWTAPLLSIGYGLCIVGGGVVIVAALWRAALASLIPVALGVFALLGPLLALCLYEMSRRLEAGEAPALWPVRFAGPRSPLQVAYIGFLVLFAALVWLRVAIMLYALFSSANYVPAAEFASFVVSTPAGLSMLAIGTAVGGVIAFAIYVCTVVSIPMLMNERLDAFSGVAAGINAVKTSPGAMFLWAWLIAILTAAGVATFFIGLAIVFPLLGHATWRAYRDLRPTA